MKEILNNACFFLFLASIHLTSHAQTLATGNFSLPALTGNGPYNFQRITFDTPFPSGTTPIVVITHTNGSDEPVTIRINNINHTGFDAIQTEPARTANNGNCGTPVSNTTPCDGAHGAIDGAFLAVTSGRQTLSDGTVIVAGINSTTTVRHRIQGSSIPVGWDSITTGENFGSAPVLLSTLQTMNNESNLIIGSPNQMTGTSQPFMNAAVRNVNGTSFDSAIELAEVNDGTTIFAPPATAQDEDIGWIAITNGVNSTITHNGSTVGFASSSFDSIRGRQNGCFNNTFSNIPASCASPVVLGSMNTRNGSNGGWVKRCNLTTNNTATGTDVTIGFHVDEDQDRDTERSHTNETVGSVVFCGPITLPVSIEQVKVNYLNSSLAINWSTSSETNSLAFEIWAKFADRWQQIGQAVNSHKTNSIDPQHYHLTAEINQKPEEIYLHHINIYGQKEYFGPYEIHQSYGIDYQAQKINWDTIKAQSIKNTVNNRKAINALNLNIQTSGTGIHRIYAQQIPEFIGLPIDDIALTLSGKAIGRFIGNNENNPTFTHQSWIDFFAVSPSTDHALYLKNNIYQLSIDANLARHAKNKKIYNASTQTHYPQSITLEQNNQYDFSTALTDPWFQQSLFRSNSNQTTQINFDTPHVVDSSYFDLIIKTYGVTDFKNYDTDGDGQINLDHHVAIYLNNNKVHDQFFDGHVANIINLKDLDSSLLNESNNTLSIELINDTGYPYDLINLEAFILKTRSKIKSHNELADLNLYQSIDSKVNLLATGFTHLPEMAYAYKNRQLFTLELESDNGVLFPSVKKTQHYWLGNTQHLKQVTIMPQSQIDETQLKIDTNYLIIAHEDFIPNVNNNSIYDDFHHYLTNKNLHPQWINVQSLYDHYGHGIPTPQAIKNFITDVSSSHDIKYVLLVGGDSYDYHDHLAIGSISHIPSWYEKTHEFITQTPTDVPYVDIDNDNLPDIAIGRWPVKSMLELQTVITNTLNFSKAQVKNTFSISENSDIDSQINYQKQLENVLTSFSIQHNQELSLDRIMFENNTINPHDIIAIAQTQLLDGINNNPELILFSGHGSPTAWTFYGLFSPQTAQQIQADGRQFYLPLACYTTYYNSPTHYSLAHQLSFAGTNGSTGLAGAVTLSHFSHNEKIAELILHGLEQGQSIGQATLNAKKQLNWKRYKDVIINWATLAEPSLTFK